MLGDFLKPTNAKLHLLTAAGIGVGLAATSANQPEHSKHMTSGAIIGGALGALAGKNSILPGAIIGGVGAGLASDLARKNNPTVSLVSNTFAGAFAVAAAGGTYLGTKMIRESFLGDLRGTLSQIKAKSPIYNNILSRAGISAGVGLLALGSGYKLARKAYAVKNSTSFKTANYAIGPSTIDSEGGSYSERSKTGIQPTHSDNSASLHITGNVTSSYDRHTVRRSFIQ